jgi:hypothetical protein
MDERCFGFIFGGVIDKIGQVTPDKERARFYIDRLKASEKDIRDEYEFIRDDIKSKCMEFKDDRRLLDRHKCAAVFMIAFMNKFKDEEINLNLEAVAILMGQLVLTIIIQDENRSCKEGSILSSIERKGFRYPPSIRDDKPYIYNWALGIHYGRLSQHLSVLSLSNELFLLERYNRDAIGNS